MNKGSRLMLFAPGHITPVGCCTSENVTITGLPLSAICGVLGHRFEEDPVKRRLCRWYWCGVFGELYGSASETRIALDFQQLMKWIADDAAPLPGTVVAEELPALHTIASALADHTHESDARQRP